MNKDKLVAEIDRNFRSNAKFAEALNWSKQRLDYTLKNVHRIRVDQVQLMAKVLNLSDQEVMDIFLS